MRALTVSVSVAALSAFVACAGGGTQAPGARPAALRPAAAPQQRCDLATLRMLELRQRNWENRGVDVRVDSTGAYVVAQVHMDQRESLASRQLTSAQIAGLLEQLRSSGFCSAAEMTRPPTEEDPSWREYQLTVRDEHGARTVRFDNRHPGVPRSLLSVVAETLRLTGQEDS